MTGFLLIDKPERLTSHDVVDAVRHLTKEKRVGHAGTLDPFATGLLIVGVGREATREFPKLVGLDKDYEAEFVLGASSDTDDRTGRIMRQEGGGRREEVQVREVMKRFVGEIEQVPPAYSAIKIGGKKMYEAARAGKPLEVKPRRVNVSTFELIGPPTLLPTGSSLLPVKISCSSGTYIRALARDLGEALGTGGYVESLRRTRIGPFSVSDAIPLKELSKETVEGRLQPIRPFLSSLPPDASPATLRT